MLSLEKAVALKKAGLRWTPQPGDLYSPADVPGEVFVCDGNVVPGPDDVWLPRLDQLLREIEKRGYGYSLDCFPGKGKRISIWKDDDFEDIEHFVASTPGDAIADALIWILTEGGLPMGD